MQQMLVAEFYNQSSFMLFYIIVLLVTLFESFNYLLGSHMWTWYGYEAEPSARLTLQNTSPLGLNIILYKATQW